MNLKGTKTEANLMAAFAGESQARNKYTYYASKAKKEGYEQIAAIFEETAGNEKEHAKIWFKLLHENDIREIKKQLDMIEIEKIKLLEKLDEQEAESAVLKQIIEYLTDTVAITRQSIENPD